jgi:hypothetical protein
MEYNWSVHSFTPLHLIIGYQGVPLIATGEKFMLGRVEVVTISYSV